MNEQTDSAESITTRTDFLVPADAVQGLTAKIAKLSRRAAKLGLAAPVMTDGGHVASRMVWRRDDEGRKIEPPIVVCLHAVTVTGERPVMDGWRFVACLHHVDGGTIVLGTGEPVPAQYRDAASACDHCRLVRKRNDTYVLGHTDGRFEQIGKSCLQDFLPGYKSVAGMALAAEMLSEVLGWAKTAEDDAEERGASGGGRPCYTLETWLVWCAVAVRLEHGFVTKKASEMSDGRRRSTAGVACGFMFPGKFQRPPSVEKVDGDLARAAIQWAEDLTDEETAVDYLHNLRTIARAGYVDDRTMGLAASILLAHDRSIMQSRPARPVSVHFGAVGVRTKKGAEFILTVDRVIPLESEQYGLSYINVMHDAAGNVAKWKTQSVLELGETYRVTATVKAHETYREVAQTVLTRCKCEKVEAEALAA